MPVVGPTTSKCAKCVVGLILSVCLPASAISFTVNFLREKILCADLSVGSLAQHFVMAGDNVTLMLADNLYDSKTTKFSVAVHSV